MLGRLNSPLWKVAMSLFTPWVKMHKCGSKALGCTKGRWGREKDKGKGTFGGVTA